MNPKLNLLIRQNQGKRILNEAGPTLERLLGNNIARLPIPDTDRLLELHRVEYKRASSGESMAIRRFISAKQADSVAVFLDCFGTSIKDEYAYYMPKQSEYIGALKVLSSILLSYRELLEFDGDSLRLTSKDEKNGLLLDWNKDDEIQHYELVVWGERWSNTAEACLSTREDAR